MCIVCQCVSCLLIASHHVTVCNIVCCLTFIAFHVVQILSPFGARHDARGSGTCKKKSKIKECVNLVLRKFCPDYSHLLYLIGWPNVESPPCRVWGVIVFSGKWLFWWHGFCVEGLHAQLASPESKTTESSQITYLSHSVYSHMLSTGCPCSNIWPTVNNGSKKRLLSGSYCVSSCSSPDTTTRHHGSQCNHSALHTLLHIWRTEILAHKVDAHLQR